MTTAVATKDGIKALISEHQADFECVLPRHMTPERLMRVALTAAIKTPKLLNCTKASLAQCLLDCAAVGLEPDGRRAHLIPYGDKCTLIIDWKGLVELGKRSGDIASWKPELVCEQDEFEYEKTQVVKHKIDFRKPRGKVFAVYSYVKFKDGTEDYEVMTVEECEAIRKRSRAGNNGPWVTDTNEMYKKCPIRRHSKRLTLSPEFEAAVAMDADSIDITKDTVFHQPDAPKVTEGRPLPKPVPEPVPAPVPKAKGRPKKEPVAPPEDELPPPGDANEDGLDDLPFDE